MCDSREARTESKKLGAKSKAQRDGRSLFLNITSFRDGSRSRKSNWEGKPRTLYSYFGAAVTLPQEPLPCLEVKRTSQNVQKTHHIPINTGSGVRSMPN